MNDTNDAIAGNQRAGDEVELTAEDLRALSAGSMGHDQIAPSTQAPAAEAREAVAGFLLERAMYRQAGVERKPTRNR
jgi:hypothetical protein